MTWTKERHEAARGRCEAATDGPWSWDRPSEYQEPTSLDAPDGRVLYATDEYGGYPECGEDLRINSADTADANFIAHARTDLPDALDRIEALTNMLDWIVVADAAIDKAVSGSKGYVYTDAFNHLESLLDTARDMLAAWEAKP